MRRQARALALAASVAMGAAFAIVLAKDSSEAPVPFDLPAAHAVLSAGEQADVYAAIILHLAGADAPSWRTARRPVMISRIILETCPKPHPRQRIFHCEPRIVGTLAPDVEISLRSALAVRGVEAVFVDDTAGERSSKLLEKHPGLIYEAYSVHQIVFDSAGILAADGDVERTESDRFLFNRVDGRWQLKSSTLNWIV